MGVEECNRKRERRKKNGNEGGNGKDMKKENFTCSTLKFNTRGRFIRIKFLYHEKVMPFLVASFSRMICCLNKTVPVRETVGVVVPLCVLELLQSTRFFYSIYCMHATYHTRTQQHAIYCVQQSTVY